MAGGPVVSSNEVVAFVKEDPKFVLLVEKTFSEYHDALLSWGIV